MKAIDLLILSFVLQFIFYGGLVIIIIFFFFEINSSTNIFCTYIVQFGCEILIMCGEVYANYFTNTVMLCFISYIIILRA